MNSETGSVLILAVVISALLATSTLFIQRETYRAAQYAKASLFAKKSKLESHVLLKEQFEDFEQQSPAQTLQLVYAGSLKPLLLGESGSVFAVTSREHPKALGIIADISHRGHKITPTPDWGKMETEFNSNACTSWSPNRAACSAVRNTIRTDQVFFGGLASNEQIHIARGKAKFTTLLALGDFLVDNSVVIHGDARNVEIIASGKISIRHLTFANPSGSKLRLHSATSSIHVGKIEEPASLCHKEYMMTPIYFSAFAAKGGKVGPFTFDKASVYGCKMGFRKNFWRQRKLLGEFGSIASRKTSAG